MKYIANFLHHPTEFLKSQHNQKLLILSFFIFILLCSLILLARSSAHRGEESANSDDLTSTSPLPKPTVTLTKWWIRMTATQSPIPSEVMADTESPESPASHCLKPFSSPLKSGIYAYISLSPPLPNRIRSSASLTSNYLGQIEPGEGLKIIQGPICADGYSWWLVESRNRSLQGWTVEGKGSMQWILPCPNENVPCTMRATPIISAVASNIDNNKTEASCRSDKLAVGMFAEVGKDSLLILRSEPYTGEVIGRAGPLSVVKVIDGPTCIGDSIWWKVNVFDLGYHSWATENDLYACPKDSECSLESFE
jgi:hypothetical protein